YFVDFSPDGNRLASASKDGAVRVWDYESRRLLHVLNGHTSEVNCVQYTPDGHLLISTGDDAAVRVWDADSGAPLATLSQHHAPVVGVSVHPDEQFMATGDAGGWVYVWDMAKRCVVQRTHAHPGCRIEAVEFSPDGQLMATCAYDGVRIWDVRDIPRIKILHLHGGNSRTVSCVGWSPDSEYLAAGNNDTVRIWEAWTGRETAQMSGPRQTPNSVCFSPDGAELAVASGGNKVWLWNPTNGQRLVTLHGHTIRLWCVRYALDGRSLATSDADGTIRTWDAEHARRLAGIAVENALDELAFTANGEALVTLGHDNGQLQLWDTEHRELRFTFPGQFSPGGFAELPAAKQLVTASREGRVDFWDLSPPEPVLLPPPMATRAQCVNVSPDGRRLACTGDALPVEVWDWERRLLLGRKLNLTGGAENRLHFSDDEEALVLQHPGGTWFWSLADGACRPFMGATQRASVIAPQRNLMYFGKPNGAITEQAVGSAIEQRVFWNQTGAITCLALSPDERFLVVGSDARVHFWDLETGWELFSAHVAPDQEAVRTMAFSPDGTVLAISTFGGDGGRGRLVFWNARPAPPLSGFTSD
ncbi:MAG: WD40 repeat domain-containing protein, partial [Planctomycetaceae bacterium]